MSNIGIRTDVPICPDGHTDGYFYPLDTIRQEYSIICRTCSKIRKYKHTGALISVKPWSNIPPEKKNN